ncbi:hypothetical protein HPP92_014626 [Vanilla planifolia]|uniref:Uncharacterized protein n=1 Tax=Vanilla planifolia TaxID=51239 RepID=A0A835QN18_VANPL|nr:hypothetical protein HPP92_014626 [Vanilla planifolia]
MGEEDPLEEMVQNLKPSTAATSSSAPSDLATRLDIPSFNSSPGGHIFYRQFPPNVVPNVAKGHSIPPVFPFLPPASPIPRSLLPPRLLWSPLRWHALPPGPSFSAFPAHSSSLSQPSFFSRLAAVVFFFSFPRPCRRHGSRHRRPFTVQPVGIQ